MRAKLWRVGILGFLVAVLLIACAQLVPQPKAPQPTAQTSTLLVAAAASLQKSLQEITSLYALVHCNSRSSRAHLLTCLFQHLPSK
jgi:ABC-type molybdate transport system substrate-binding protein